MISDFQKSTLGSTRITLDSADKFYLVPLAFVKTSNLFVDSVYLTNPFLFADNTNEINVKVRNVGNDEAKDIILKLFVNGLQVATAGITVNAQAVAEATFNINFKLEAHNACRISFEDFPVTFDNDFYFALNQGRKIDILGIQGENASDVLSDVYANEQLFNYQAYSISNLDYNLINNADLVILNEVRPE